MRTAYLTFKYKHKLYRVVSPLSYGRPATFQYYNYSKWISVSNIELVGRLRLAFLEAYHADYLKEVGVAKAMENINSYLQKCKQRVL